MRELENLSAFRARTAGFMSDSLPHSGELQTAENLLLKVAATGSMEPFIGNTVVFPLPEQTKQEISLIQRRLYQLCAPALAEPLEPAAFHMTLHDLLSGKPTQELMDHIDCMKDSALNYIRRISDRGEIVHLHSTALFNMVNTSMVLGFEPMDEESCRRLMTDYDLLQEVVCLDYPFTPHVTVAYFQPGTIKPEMVEKLRSVVDEVKAQKKIEMEISEKAVEYQLFSDMNHYWCDR